MVRHLAPALAALVLAAAASAAPAMRDLPAPVFGGVVRVTDGDTIRIGEVRVRLAVADAPERGQICDLRGKPWACGDAATAMLTAIIADRPVTCRHRGKASHGRIVAICEAGGVNLSLAMVERGMAVVDGRFLAEWPDLAPTIRAAQSEARVAQRGLWAAQAETPAAARRAARPGES
jgi:endonuclease YncB( thermonuclease family)